MRIGSLFSGIDGLALGVQMSTQGRVLWHSEIDPDACRVLHSHWRAPNLGDISNVDWTIVPRVDALVGGFPCQDISVMGSKAGLAGAKSGLWKEYKRAIEAIRPEWVFIENVSAIRSRGLSEVLKDLAACGYDATWSTVKSSDIGAPHRRSRMFIAAHADGHGQFRISEMHRRNGSEDQDTFGHHTDGRRADGHDQVSAGNPTMGANPRKERRRTSPYRRVNPDFVEWMMGFPPGWTCMCSRRARLRLLGNAVQPQVAQYAWEELTARLSQGAP